MLVEGFEAGGAAVSIVYGAVDFDGGGECLTQLTMLQLEVGEGVIGGDGSECQEWGRWSRRVEEEQGEDAGLRW